MPAGSAQSTTDPSGKQRSCFCADPCPKRTPQALKRDGRALKFVDPSFKEDREVSPSFAEFNDF